MLETITPEAEKSIPDIAHLKQGHESPVPSFPVSALLTCKSFYYIITSIKFNGLTLVETLQRFQNEILTIYLDDSFFRYNDDDNFRGTLDINDHIQSFRDLFGCFMLAIDSDWP